MTILRGPMPFLKLGEFLRLLSLVGIMVCLIGLLAQLRRMSTPRQAEVADDQAGTYSFQVIGTPHGMKDDDTIPYGGMSPDQGGVARGRRFFSGIAMPAVLASCAVSALFAVASARLRRRDRGIEKYFDARRRRRCAARAPVDEADAERKVEEQKT